MTTNTTAPVGYLVRERGPTWFLAILAHPANGPEYVNAPRVAVAGKREARAYCKAHGITPWNF